MAGLDWYPRYSRKALDGMRPLTLEQRGAYNTLVDLIYDRGGPVPDDDRWLAGWMGVTVRRWRQIRDELIAAGRVVERETPRGPVLSDELAEKEIENQKNRRKTNAESGAKGGKRSAETRRATNENSDLDQAIAGPSAQATLKLETETVEEEPPKAPKGADQPTSISVSQADVAAVWAITPNESRRRSSQRDLHRAMTAAARRGREPGSVRAGLIAYFASPEATKDGGAFVKGVHRMVENDRWEAFAPARAGSEAPDRTAGWSDATWRAAVATFAESGRWGDACGPPPDNPACRAPPAVLAELGFNRNPQAA